MGGGVGTGYVCQVRCLQTKCGRTDGGQRPILKPHLSNLITRYEDRKINVASIDHVFQPTGIIFELVQEIIGMNLLTKFQEDQTVNVASRVLTRFYYSHIRKNDPRGSHFFQANIIIFELIQDIIETNLLTKFHEDWK
ncbi:hypothetical protein DPMN_133510 [Dreissena polymorpha]|uniref:Uncharacterized protein n=1 Tax=Dreissena polymorpha TaxID=45954 RepID=A0A9D4FY20_DREPO|nr:hypothetical protein DPMN_133510 [Dreissena polymorpha]